MLPYNQFTTSKTLKNWNPTSTWNSGISKSCGVNGLTLGSTSKVTRQLRAFSHALNGQETQIGFVPILRQKVGDANPWLHWSLVRPWDLGGPWGTLGDLCHVSWCVILYQTTTHISQRWSIQAAVFQWTQEPMPIWQTQRAALRCPWPENAHLARWGSNMVRWDSVDSVRDLGNLSIARNNPPKFTAMKIGSSQWLPGFPTFVTIEMGFVSSEDNGFVPWVLRWCLWNTVNVYMMVMISWDSKTQRSFDGSGATSSTAQGGGGSCRIGNL